MAVDGHFGVNHLNKKCYFLEVWAISSFCTAIFNGIAMEVGIDALFILTPVGTKVRFRWYGHRKMLPTGDPRLSGQKR